MSDEVRVALDGGVLRLTLNRPQKKNALTSGMYGALAAALARADEDPQIRCVLIEGEGDSFCGGADLSEFASINAGEAETSAAMPLIEALARARTPLVAAVQGRAVGIGLTLLLHCDLVFVAEDARLSTPFVNLGLVPEAASSLLLPARIGHVRAFAMFALGEAIDGRTAAAWGLANAAAPAAEVQARALAAAREVAQRPAAAVALTKALMRDAAAYARRIEEEAKHFSAQLKSEEARAAFEAFFARGRSS
jgi:enoyl-CoA hydratase/carnithine racemase